MTAMSSSDPLEIRVLLALTSGAASALDIAMRTGESQTSVASALEQAVAEQTVTRFGPAKSPAYSLTPKGLHAVAIHQGTHGAVVDPVPEPPPPTQVAADPLPPEPLSVDVPVPEEAVPVPGRGGARPRVQWRHVVYAVAYVVLGLAFLLLSPVVGVVVLLAGLALGAWTLRPLWRPTPADDGHDT